MTDTTARGAGLAERAHRAGGDGPGAGGRGERLVEQDGAEAVILVGAVMVGLPRALESWAPEPLVEGMACGVLLAELLVRLGTRKARSGSLQAPTKREVVTSAGRSAKGCPDDLGHEFSQLRRPRHRIVSIPVHFA